MNWKEKTGLDKVRITGSALRGAQTGDWLGG